MVYFQVSPVGFDCGLDKNNCKKYPDFCKECVQTQLEKFGLDLKQNIKFTIIDSEEKRIQMFQDQIWQKFLDVLNLKHILLMTKHSGLPILDYPISGAGVNTEVLTGFIQANITFSESSTNSNSIDSYKSNHQFYEFQYETFSILLKNGQFIRICLVLDHKASVSLKTLVSEFLQDYEARYMDKLERVVNAGMLTIDEWRKRHNLPPLEDEVVKPIAPEEIEDMLVEEPSPFDMIIPEPEIEEPELPEESEETETGGE